MKHRLGQLNPKPTTGSLNLQHWITHTETFQTVMFKMSLNCDYVWSPPGF